MLRNFLKFRPFSSALMHESPKPHTNYHQETQGFQKRERPAQASFFTGKPEYFETLFFLEDVIKNSPKVPEDFEALLQRHWVPRGKLSELLRYELSQTQHESICDKLNSLSRISEYTKNLDIKALVDSFTVNKDVVDNQIKQKSDKNIDAFGRVWAIGRRKTSVAKVFLLEGEGKVLVNGKSAADYFSKMSNLAEIVKPFEVAQRLGKYNIWALTSKGGFTGQAGAIALGIAKALVIKEPELFQVLNEKNLLTRDPRMVERKKPGKPKARKSFTWVKR